MTFLAFLIACTALVSPAVAVEDPPMFLLEWGSRGSANDQFDFPRRLAVHSDGTVYVSDRNNARIQKFTDTGVFIATWGTYGSGDGQLDIPFGVGVDAANQFVYVAERNNNRVQKFTSDGVFVTKWGGPIGAGPGEFNLPIGLDIGPDGNVYVGDSFNNRVQKFSPTGVYLDEWGSAGNGNGQFNFPIGIAVDADGRVYVGDSGNNRIQKFSSTGTFLGKWGSVGSGDGQFASPRGVGVGPDGSIYVADTINNRIQKFTNIGVFLTKWGTFGTGEGQFNRPEDVEVDGAGNIYVVDPGNNRIQKFGDPAVPVTLVRFVAERDADAVVVRWEIHSDLSYGSSFQVFRQEPGKRREELGRTLSGRESYRVRDTNAPDGRVDYWLREINVRGQETFHGPLTVAPRVLLLTLEAAYPNPFNPATTVHFSVPTAGIVRVAVHDARGGEVQTLIDEWRAAGDYDVSWNGRNSRGEGVASGVYFIRLQFENRVRNVKITMTK